MLFDAFEFWTYEVVSSFGSRASDFEPSTAPNLVLYDGVRSAAPHHP
jgi:hypothetical protein